MVKISAAVEGLVDEAVVRRLMTQVGAEAGPIYGREGKGRLRTRINGYNHAARHSPWIVLVDLDHDVECAPELCEAWVPHKSESLCFRVAIREVEAWLMADRERLAAFLSVPLARVPLDPDAEDNPKQVIISIAARSRRKQIVEDMVPRPGSSRSVGPAYTSRMIQFANETTNGWRPLVAADRSNSLHRAIECIRRLAES